MRSVRGWDGCPEFVSVVVKNREDGGLGQPRQVMTAGTHGPSGQPIFDMYPLYIYKLRNKLKQGLRLTRKKIWDLGPNQGLVLTSEVPLCVDVKAPEAHLRARLQPKSLVINLFVDMKVLFMQVKSL